MFTNDIKAGHITATGLREAVTVTKSVSIHQTASNVTNSPRTHHLASDFIGIE